MTTQEAAMRKALTCLESVEHDAAYFQTVNADEVDATIESLRAALAQQGEQPHGIKDGK